MSGVITRGQFVWAKRNRDSALKFLQGLTDERLAEFFRRCEETSAIDGYGRGQSDTGRVSTGEVSSSTESAALALLEGTPLADVQYEALTAMCVHLRTVSDEIRAATENARFLLHVGAEKEGRESGLTDCRACARPVSGTPKDRLRSGYCQACYAAWDRSGRPDRLVFEQGRPQSNASSLEPDPAA